ALKRLSSCICRFSPGRPFCWSLKANGPMTTSTKGRLSASLLVLGFGLLYWQVIVKLVSDWYNDDNYSHGFLIVPIAAYFVWERRGRLKAAASNPSALGLVVVVASILVLLAGILGSELFLTRISILGVLVGAVLFLFGWRHLRILAFP